jgi:hypothetical protein
VATNVGRIERGETVSEAPEDVSQYGLLEPEIRVEVELDEGEREEIQFGSANPSGDSYYTRLASGPEVFLTPATWRGMFEKEADDLRDKTLLRFDQGAIDRVEVAPSGPVMVRDNGEWFLEGSPRLPADDGEVGSFLSSLAATRATGFASADAADPDALEIRLHDANADQEHVLAFGAEIPENSEQVYARDRSRDPVFIVSSTLRDRATAPAAQWRDKTIAEVDPDSVTTIRIVRAGAADVILSRSDDSWTLDDGRTAAASRVDAMLSAFDFREASEVIDDAEPMPAYGLDSPGLRVVFVGDAGEILDFSFGEETSDGGGVYWKAADEAAVKVVPQTVRSPFEVDEADLLDAVP